MDSEAKELEIVKGLNVHEVNSLGLTLEFFHHTNPSSTYIPPPSTPTLAPRIMRAPPGHRLPTPQAEVTPTPAPEKTTGYYETKEYRRQKKVQHAKLYVSSKIIC